MRLTFWRRLLVFFIAIAVITLFFVINNKELMKKLEAATAAS